MSFRSFPLQQSRKTFEVETLHLCPPGEGYVGIATLGLFRCDKLTVDDSCVSYFGIVDALVDGESQFPSSKLSWWRRALNFVLRREAKRIAVPGFAFSSATIGSGVKWKTAQRGILLHFVNQSNESRQFKAKLEGRTVS